MDSVLAVSLVAGKPRQLRPQVIAHPDLGVGEAVALAGYRARTVGELHARRLHLEDVRSAGRVERIRPLETYSG
jgi:hypothetical protein